VAMSPAAAKRCPITCLLVNLAACSSTWQEPSQEHLRRQDVASYIGHSFERSRGNFSADDYKHFSTNITILAKLASEKDLDDMADALSSLSAGAVASFNAKAQLPTRVALLARRGRLDPVIAWLSRGGSFKVSGQLLLTEAVLSGDLALTTELLQRGANPNERASLASLSVLSFALRRQRVKLTQLLLEYSADANNVNTKSGVTPLMEAVMLRHEELISLLIEHGARVDVHDNKLENTPLMLATIPPENRYSTGSPPPESPKPLMLLLNAGANTELQNGRNMTALVNAVERGLLEHVAGLIAAGARYRYSLPATSKMDFEVVGGLKWYNAISHARDQYARERSNPDRRRQADPGQLPTGDGPVYKRIAAMIERSRQPDMVALIRDGSLTIMDKANQLIRAGEEQPAQMEEEQPAQDHEESVLTSWLQIILGVIFGFVPLLRLFGDPVVRKMRGALLAARRGNAERRRKAQKLEQLTRHKRADEKKTAEKKKRQVWQVAKERPKKEKEQPARPSILTAREKAALEQAAKEEEVKALRERERRQQAELARQAEIEALEAQRRLDAEHREEREKQRRMEAEEQAEAAAREEVERVAIARERERCQQAEREMQAEMEAQRLREAAERAEQRRAKEARQAEEQRRKEIKEAEEQAVALALAHRLDQQEAEAMEAVALDAALAAALAREEAEAEAAAIAREHARRAEAARAEHEAAQRREREARRAEAADEAALAGKGRGGAGGRAGGRGGAGRGGRGQQRSVDEEPAASSAAGPSRDEGNDEDNTCVVCFSEPRTHAFIPCGHKCICEACGKKVMKKDQLCPMCRDPASQIFKIFG